MWTAQEIPDSAAQRALANVTVDDETGCWNSNFYRSGNGYAHVTQRDENKRDHVYLAHRAAYTAVHGPIPDGMVIDHACFNRGCVNPSHLRMVTLARNTQLRLGKDFPEGTCGFGHPDSDMKEYHWGGRRQRACSACLKIRNDESSAWRLPLRRLELTYGLRLTKKQQDMVDEFMPERQEDAA